MRKGIIKAVALSAAFMMCINITGCGKSTGKNGKKSDVTSEGTAADKEDEVEPEATTAAGKGNDGSDRPLVMSCEKFSDDVNPFKILEDGDEMAVKATQAFLVTFDRKDQVVFDAVKGETIKYGSKKYKYVGISDVNIKYKKNKNETQYDFVLSHNLKFSDGYSITADDVIFSLYAFCDKSYKGDYSLRNTDIAGLKNYKNGSSDNIRGIVKKSKYEVSVTTYGYDKEMIKKLNIPITPLHIYGSLKKYNYGKGKFGFTKGDISKLKKKETLAGAGPYKFIKNDGKILYFEANTEYYKGCPNIAFLQIKKIESTVIATKIMDLKNGVYDVMSFGSDKTVIDNVTELNSNHEVNGKSMFTKFMDGDSYQLICMNAKNVCVNERPDSTRSKYLRKALAVMFAADRQNLCDNYYSYTAKVINYPYSSTSWAVPESTDESYNEAFTVDEDGAALYEKGMDSNERLDKALEQAKEYFKLAGYDVKDDMVVAVDSTMPTSFVFSIDEDDDKGGCLYEYLMTVSEKLADIGINLKVETKDAEKIEEGVKYKSLQIWNQNFETKSDIDFEDLYYGNYSFEKNIFSIADSDVDELIDASEYMIDYEEKSENYRSILNILNDWAVVVPMFQYRNSIVFNAKTIEIKSMPSDITRYYDWFNEIEKVTMKAN
ncbi:MAG: hypothetical protein K6D02_03830 [Lachnospiraceae bacterium]|nr:hypothetical protein [Lachnospiraceae bacterium]